MNISSSLFYYEESQLVAWISLIHMQTTATGHIYYMYIFSISQTEYVHMVYISLYMHQTVLFYACFTTLFVKMNAAFGDINIKLYAP